MLPVRVFRCALPCLLAALAGGCALFRGEGRSDAGASAAKVDEARARYRLEVDAPKPLREILSEHLDLARFRDAPRSAGLDAAELDRLIAAAPEQGRALLATEGYFGAQVRVSRDAAPAADGLPVVRVAVDPGTRTRVDTLSLAFQGELQQRAERGDADARRLIAQLREGWPLRRGEPFRQADWTSAKNSTLGRLHAGGYPSATWVATDAAVRAQQAAASLSATASSGPLFHLGGLRIEGLRRYDERVVRNLAALESGMPYGEQRLLDAQDRLVRSNLFEGAVAEIDSDPQKAAATPVTLRVQERPLQNLTLGLGYSTDTGTRATAEHWHRRPFGLRWTAQNKLELGNQRKAWEFDYRSYTKPGFRRNLLAGMVERWSGPDEERKALRLRAGRSWDDPRLERQLYGEFNRAHVERPNGETSDARSLTAHVDWNRRRVDSLLLPTRGHALLLQGAAGHAWSSSADNGPLARAYARLTMFRPFGRDWHGTARVEAGQVFARQRVGIPDTLLFRAGGEESVRGYEHRSLGPIVDGVVVSGRSLFTASAEIARPISAQLPQVWGAAFVDAGNAALRFADIRPAVGVGVGVRYRSPVGPLKFDVAYGVDDKKVRVHLSAGVTF